MKMLIDKGANLQSHNEEEVSCFALLAVNLNQQSPLSITKYDAAIFLCSLVLWSTQLLPSQMIDPRLLQTLQLTQYSSLLFNFNKSALLFSLVSFIGINASLISEDLNFVAVGVSAALTMNLAYHTFQGLRSCWRNSSLGYGKALLKTTVVYAPKVTLSFNQLRGFGQKLGILSQTIKTPLEKLNERDIKCVKFGRDQGIIPSKCFEKSLEAYSSCIADPDSISCKETEIALQDYLLRPQENTYEGHCTDWVKEVTNI